MALRDELLEFWFGTGTDPYRVDEHISSRWFEGQPSFDEEIRRTYGDDVERAIRGEYDAWAETAEGRMALILLLDQFPRHLFRGSPRSWTQDLLAQRLTLEGMRVGHDRQLRPLQLFFFYLPLEHAEDVHLQELSVDAYTRLAAGLPDDAELIKTSLDYALRHQRVIERFGRFPHRNAVIGRPNTPEEAEFLAGPDAPF